ncbi:hypothetical protein SAY87_013376 [Trapa incisa]|uniref:Chloroplast sensor kinase, chloroplastic n=1 Tax=Trapa incisa TaxID=236973 RepID=A0AAN7QD69_9MYRT|nr:hypothetical protein SAY87_013376 [Trapa incisa]
MLTSSVTTPQVLLYSPNSSIATSTSTVTVCSLLPVACRCISPKSSPASHKLSSLSVSRNSSSLLDTSPVPPVQHVSDDDSEGPPLVSSASAVASAIRRVSNSPVEFVQRIEKDQRSGLVLPSPDFQRLCIEQLDLFRRIVNPEALLSVYVRPAGSYVMDRLELRQVTSYPETEANAPDLVILIGNFNVPTGLRAAEAALSNQEVLDVPKSKAVVFPMVKHPFVVGFLVAELPLKGDHESLNSPSPEKPYDLSLSGVGVKLRDSPSLTDEKSRMYILTAEQRSNAVNISHSLAMAHVMDQKALLLQQSSWQNNVRMSTLVEQIRGPLSSIQTLTKMLSLHMKRSEIAHDIVEDIMVQGDQMRDTLQKLQEAVHITKSNIMRYNEESLRKMNGSTYGHQGSATSHLLNNLSEETSQIPRVSSISAVKDLELPMPPLALAPLRHHGIRPSNVSDVLSDLVGAISPLADRQKRSVGLSELSHTLPVAVEEPSLRQALSNLIEGALLRTNVGGRVEILSTGAPAGGTLVVIDDDGPDMHYMTQMHSLMPFGPKLSSENMIEDNMTWNFVAGLTVAREILESYGCVVRVISPRIPDAALGTGGTRVELWLPSFTPSPSKDDLVQEG